MKPTVGVTHPRPVPVYRYTSHGLCKPIDPLCKGYATMADEAHRVQVLRDAVDEYRKSKAAALKATLLFARATLASWVMHPLRQKLQLEWRTKRGTASWSVAMQPLERGHGKPSATAAWLSAASDAVAAAQGDAAMAADAEALALGIWERHYAILRQCGAMIDTGRLSLGEAQTVLDGAHAWAGHCHC